MLPNIRVLQVGDVHLPSAVKAQRNIDHKDQTFSVELRNVISSMPTKVVFKKIYELLEQTSIDALFFMGDFTDIGSLEHYDSAANFLANALQIGDQRIHSNIQIGIVPGNHDINRDLARKPGLSTKFTPLNQTLKNYGLPKLPVEQSISMQIEKKNASINVNLMNSCWGCGASEYIPEEFRSEIHNAIEKTISSGNSHDLRTYYDRQFDTPAFSNECITELVQRAQTLDKQTLLMIVAHHNLLPQRLARLAPYTELVNSGALRASLSECKRPVIYLHGHIHEDPIETISTPDGGQMICISAPAVDDGFNIIDITYTPTGTPLICRVSPWRFNKSGILHKSEGFTLPLIGKRRRSDNKTLTKLYMYLLKQGECYWADLKNHKPAFFKVDNEMKIQECIELLMADRTIDVENYDMTPSNWIIRASL